MGLLDLFRRERRGDPLENPSVSLSSPGIWAWLVGGNNPTSSGELINHYTALQQNTVYACVNLLAEAVASLPCKVFSLSNDGRMEDFDHPLYYKLTVEPNPDMTAFTFIETITGCLALTGNGYAEILRDKSGQIAEFYPLHPLRTEPRRDEKGDIFFLTSDGMPGGQSRRIAAANMIHVRLFSLDGLKGMSPIDQARQGVGLARAAEKYGARFFGNDSKPGGVMIFKGRLDPKTEVNVRESWERNQGGENQGKTAFLSGDWDYKQIGISPEQAQFLATRQFQRAEIAALWRIPPHMVGDTTRLSNNNAEQQNLNFVTDTLRPYLCRIESEIVRKCIPRVGRNAGMHYVQFDVTERLRGDFKTTQEGYATGRQWGWYSANAVLKEQGKNPIGPAGDVYMVPVNMQNAERLLDTEPVQDQPIGSQPGDGEADRNLMRQLTLCFGRMLRDAAGRACSRKERDLEAIQRVFTPVLTGISEQVSHDLQARFQLAEGWESQHLERSVREACKTLEKRAAAWTPESVDQVVAEDLRRVVRSVVLNLYREAGAALALKGELHG